MWTSEGDEVFFPVRGLKPAANGSYYYQFSIARPCPACKDRNVFIDRSRTRIKDFARNTGGGFTLVGTKRDFCAYVDTYCDRIQGVGGLAKTCGITR